MKNKPLTVALLFLIAIAAIGFNYSNLSPTTSASEEIANLVSPNKTYKTMRAFRSEQELKDYFRQLAEKQRSVREEQTANSNASGDSSPTNAPAAKSEAKSDSGKDDESITNNQHAGVDEGDIVKLHGDHLVVLRRGRLFTVKIGDNDLKPVDAVDAYPPGIDPRNDWYDEMLVSKDTIVVIGYSYGRGGTEINLFDITDAGRLGYR